LLGRLLEESGFVATAAGYQMRRVASAPVAEPDDPDDDA
jgi:hypothetical protein